MHTLATPAIHIHDDGHLAHVHTHSDVTAHAAAHAILTAILGDIDTYPNTTTWLAEHARALTYHQHVSRRSSAYVHCSCEGPNWWCEHGDGESAPVYWYTNAVLDEAERRGALEIGAANPTPQPGQTVRVYYILDRRPATTSLVDARGRYLGREAVAARRAVVEVTCSRCWEQETHCLCS